MFGDNNITWKETRVVKQKERFISWLEKICGRQFGHIDETNPEYSNEDHPSVATPSSSTTTTTSTTPTLVSSPKPKKLVVIEIGCGVSLHSLRLEVELLMDSLSKEQLRCIRINPTDHNIREGHVGIGLGSLECLKRIESVMLSKIDEPKPQPQPLLESQPQPQSQSQPQYYAQQQTQPQEQKYIPSSFTD
eukprot:TRINITY_DN286_c0_g1_i1.p1 TRINITY_DN286_c0_g1~~TRINITY_DN286_c0_g1_i1.p1  ORF type:complete len:191 (+),score=58.12 TRINITY_DN286_c0_g1_i1:362-934(+)